MSMRPYDALLVVSFGGPEGQEEVIPFMENVLRGRNIPRARLKEVAEHYYHFDGVSPINAQNRALIAALAKELGQNGLDLPIYFGNRNWKPFLTDTMQQMADDGVQRALAFFTSAYSSYSGCRQYRENIFEAQAKVGVKAPQVDKLRLFYNHPLFISVNEENVRAALEQIPADRRTEARIVFTAHSLPASMARNCAYEAQLQETACLVTAQLQREHWELVYQSRSGPPHQPWLEPDICDHLAALQEEGVTDVVVAPIGFISDHMEVLFDLDTQAQEVSQEIGINMVRAATPGTHPQFIEMIRELIVERVEMARQGNPLRRALGEQGPSHDVCPADCCLPGISRRHPSRPQPA